jgi:transcriptional regulator with XRE-family HTH domain
MANAPTRHRKQPKDPLDHDPASVRNAREAAGLTRTALAKEIGRSLSLVSEIESGTRNATPEVLPLIAEALDCPIDELRRKEESA